MLPEFLCEFPLFKELKSARGSIDDALPVIQFLRWFSYDLDVRHTGLSLTDTASADHLS